MAVTDEIEIVEYDPGWPGRFCEEAAMLRRVLDPDVILEIEHVGSTAVPSLCAKPIIDILITVSSITEARRAIDPLRSFGYVFWSDNPRKDRLFFVKGIPPYGVQRTHHLHFMEKCAEAKEYRLFRDYLRAHQTAAHGYAALKHQLATEYCKDREAYTNAKRAYVSDCIAKAQRRLLPGG
jgi:GrpB-like predicted nucleotidyltransferase (UPF0157 family)